MIKSLTQKQNKIDDISKLFRNESDILWHGVMRKALQ